MAERVVVVVVVEGEETWGRSGRALSTANASLRECKAGGKSDQISDWDFLGLG
jgi:hypothetical protein